MIGLMVKIRTRLFLKVWLWSFFSGILLGLGITLLIGWMTGIFNVPAGSDDMAQGFAFIIILFGIGNLANYIVAIVVGYRFVHRKGQNTKIYLEKCVPLSILAFFLSISVLLPLLLFGSLVAAFIVTVSINKILPQPEVSPINTPALPNLNQAGGN
jgi:formate/nitrite transporter FocA (FNT family)